MAQLEGIGPVHTVFMASGQGSQKPGMGVSLFGVPEVQAALECASDVFDRDIVALINSEGDEVQVQLNETRNAQVAIAALSIGIGRALMARGIRPDALLGFSLGQISALALADMLTDEEAFRLIDVRSRVMDEAARSNPGAMTALLKADEESVMALCEQCAQDDVLAPANFNCPGQIVVAGTVPAIERAEEAWKEQGGKLSRLATQGAFHSPLMQAACDPFAEYLATVDFKEPVIPVICNTDATPLDTATVRQRLVDHLTHPVRFQQSVEALRQAGADTFVEVGFGGVLSGLVRRIDKEATRCCVQDRPSFEELAESWRESDD